MLMEIFLKNIPVKVIRVEAGMAKATIARTDQLLRKKYNTKKAKMPPTMPSWPRRRWRLR